MNVLALKENDSHEVSRSVREMKSEKAIYYIDEIGSCIYRLDQLYSMLIDANGLHSKKYSV